MKAATSAHSTRPPLSESSQRKSKCRSLNPLYETNLLVGRLFWDFPYWNAVLRVQLWNIHVLMFMSEPGNPAELCHHFLTSLCRTPRTCKHTNMHGGGVQTNTHTERDRNDDNALRSKWPQPANASMFFYSNSTSLSRKKKTVFFSRCSHFSSQIKTALKSKWSSSISVSEVLTNKYRQAVVWREKSWVHVLGGD